MRVNAVPLNPLPGPAELPGARALTARDVAAVGGAPATPAPATGATSGPSFSETLGQALGKVNEQLHEADRQAQRVATGEAENLHDSLVAMAEADLALQVTMRVTQKAISAYQEISRMQM